LCILASLERSSLRTASNTPCSTSSPSSSSNSRAHVIIPDLGLRTSSSIFICRTKAITCPSFTSSPSSTSISTSFPFIGIASVLSSDIFHFSKLSRSSHDGFELPSLPKLRQVTNSGTMRCPFVTMHLPLHRHHLFDRQNRPQQFCFGDIAGAEESGRWVCVCCVYICYAFADRMLDLNSWVDLQEVELFLVNIDQKFECA
ncbi:hypothetical protein KCV06_g652, partial [Aureobasidium melanogenum]